MAVFGTKWPGVQSFATATGTVTPLILKSNRPTKSSGRLSRVVYLEGDRLQVMGSEPRGDAVLERSPLIAELIRVEAAALDDGTDAAQHVAGDMGGRVDGSVDVDRRARFVQAARVASGFACRPATENRYSMPSSNTPRHGVTGEHTVQGVPHGATSITPWIGVPGAGTAIAFYQSVFGEWREAR